MPLVLIAFFIIDLISIAYPFIAYYLWREWNTYNNTVNDDYADRCLYGMIGLLILIFLGRFLMKMLLSNRRKGEDEPHMLESKMRTSVKRPDDSIINVEYYGKETGQPIIFVHGLNSNIKNWYYQIKFFEKNFRIIAMDLPGLGKSTRPSNKDFSLNKMAYDLNAVIEHTGAKNPILWGHSMGGMTILTLVAKNKTILQTPIKAIILQHTTYTNPVKTILFRRFMTAIEKPVLVPLCWIMIVLSAIIWIARWMSYINGNSHILSRWLTFAGTQSSKQLDFSTLLSTLAPPAVTGRSCLGMFKYDVSKQLPTIDIPTLIIAADKDRLTRPDASKHMAGQIPNAHLSTVKPGNHQGLIERHFEVNKIAEHFISELNGE
jgi:pimeloyl-ACP methyl ester carboxylesterase